MMENGLIPNALASRRLQVFQSLYSPDPPQMTTRNIKLEGLDPDTAEDALLSVLARFGPVQCLDLQNLAQTQAIVSYYDLRHAEAAYASFRSYLDCVYLPPPSYPEYADYLVFQDFAHSSLDEIVSVLEEFGDIKGVFVSGKIVCLQFYDTRARQKAFFELQKLMWLEKYEDVMDVSQLLFESIGKVHGPEDRIGHTEECSYSTTSSPGSNLDSSDGKTEESEPVSYTVSLEAIASGKDFRTSIMIKNIPNKYSQQLLLEAIDKNNKGKYDFFYLPIDFKNKCNVGYAFLNFLSSVSIVEFYLEFNDKKWNKFNSAKVCEVTYGRIQGRSALIQHFQASSVMSHEDARVKPVILPLLVNAPK